MGIVIDFAMQHCDDPLPCRIKEGWDDAGQTGVYCGKIGISQWWCVVVWDGDDEPSLHKAAGLEVSVPKWECPQNNLSCDAS